MYRRQGDVPSSTPVEPIKSAAAAKSDSSSLSRAIRRRSCSVRVSMTSFSSPYIVSTLSPIEFINTMSVPWCWQRINALQGNTHPLSGQSLLLGQFLLQSQLLLGWCGGGSRCGGLLWFLRVGNIPVVLSISFYSSLSPVPPSSTFESGGET